MGLLDLKFGGGGISPVLVKVLVIVAIAAVIGIIWNDVLSGEKLENVDNDSTPLEDVSPVDENGQGTLSCTETNGGVEICDDEIDQDCDGYIDELCSCPLYPDCSGDVNGDSIVNQADFDIIVENWARRDCGVENQCCSGSDLNWDGWVNFEDLSIYSDNRENIC